MKFYFQICFAIYSAIFVNTLADKLHFGHRIRTDAIENEFFVFEMTPLNDVQNCVESCKSKKQCKGINYDHRAKLCYHVAFSNTALVGEDFNVMEFIEKKPGFSYGDKSEWNMTDYQDCENCHDVGECNVNRCQHSGCKLPEEKNNAIYRGNMFSIGNQIAYECKAGYKTNSTDLLTSTCLGNGTWSSREFECLPDAVFGDDIHSYDNNFYKVINLSQDWYDSNKTCDQLEMHLVDIETAEEQTFLQGILTVYTKDTCYWVGGRRGTNDELYWSDGNLVEVVDLDWRKGQPDNFPGDEGQDCVRLEQNTFVLNDMKCSESCYAVCELR